MSVPVSIRPDDDARDELENHAAREARRTRIRQASAAIGAHVATSTDGQAIRRQIALAVGIAGSSPA